MTMVTLRLGAPESALETAGTIYREGDDLPVARGVSLTGWRPWAGELGAGRHRYVFEVRGGDGPFSLWLEEHGVWRQLADFAADRGNHLRVHRFEVLGAGPVALAQARLRRLVRAAACWGRRATWGADRPPARPEADEPGS